MLERGKYAQNKPHKRSKSDSHSAHGDTDRQTALNQLADGCVFAYVVAYSETAAEHIVDIFGKLHDQRLI